MYCVINQGGQKLYALLYNIFIQYKWRKTYFINVSVVGYNSEVSLIYVKACWLRQAFILRLTDNVLAFIPLSELRTLSQKDIYSKIFKEYRTCVNRCRTGKFFLFFVRRTIYSSNWRKFRLLSSCNNYSRFCMHCKSI